MEIDLSSTTPTLELPLADKQARKKLEQQQLHRAMEEIGQALMYIAAGSSASDPTAATARFGGAIGMLDRACYRIARMSTDKPFNGLPGGSPIEEASRALTFYANGADYSNAPSQMDDASHPSRLAKEWLEKFGVPFKLPGEPGTFLK
jgi:hypothetical protein